MANEVPRFFPLEKIPWREKNAATCSRLSKSCSIKKKKKKRKEKSRKGEEKKDSIQKTAREF